MNEELLCALMTVLGYLLGAIPFGIVVSKALGLPDPRTVGSKNVGFTNVLRVSGKKAGVLTLLGDMGKGWVLGWAAMQWLTVESFIMVVALAPILGHLFSPFLGFKGGKGVATAMGVVLGLSPSIGLLVVIDLAGGRRDLALFIRWCAGSLRVLSGRGDCERTATGVFYLFPVREHADLDQA